MLFLLGSLGLAILIGLAISTDQNNRAQRTANKIQVDEQINANRQLLRARGVREIFESSRSGGGVLAISWENKTLGIGNHMSLKLNDYEFGQIRSVEVEVDGSTVTTESGSISTRRGSQVAGAAVGSLILGPTGLLIGGLTGGKKIRSTSEETKTINSVGLVVRVSDRTTPLYRISFYVSPAKTGTILTYPKLVEATKAAYRWHALITQAMEEAPLLATKADLAPSEPAIVDVADQIGRLWKLQQAGALSISEFNEQKQKLIGS